MLEAIGNFITADNPTWEGTATELIEKLELDIKPNALSLKLNINAGKLYNLFFVQYSNSRSHKGRKITLRYDEDHPIIVELNRILMILLRMSFSISLLMAIRKQRCAMSEVIAETSLFMI